MITKTQKKGLQTITKRWETNKNKKCKQKSGAGRPLRDDKEIKANILT